MLNVIASFKSKAGQEQKIIDAFNKSLKEVKKETGTVEYRLLRSQNDPLSFAVVEQYKDIDAFMVHGSAAHLVEMIETWIPLFDGNLEVITYDEIAKK